MRMIESIDVTEAMLTSSSVPETDYAVWSAATNYALAARVIKNHRVWESVQADNLGHDPEADTLSTYWVNIGATNRWRVFDHKLAPATSQVSNITYVITLTKRINAIALFGLIGNQVRVVIKDASDDIHFDETFELAAERTISGWWDWYFEPFAVASSRIAWDVPGFVGYRVEITVRGSGTRSVGEILLGRTIRLGETLVDTELGFRDFSIKDRDDWGGWQIVERGYSRTVDYRFVVAQDDVDRVFRTILRNRARMCVFSAGDETDIYGTTVLGFINEDGLSIPISTRTCFATLSVEGLTEE